MKTKLLLLLSLITLQINAQCWSKIASGQFHTLAIAQNGTLWAWGANNYGQLGDGTMIYRDLPVQIGTDTDWSVIEAGYNHSLAIKTNGTLYTWGRNNKGQLGIGNTSEQNQPYQNYNITQVMAVAAGESFSLAIKTDGTLLAWGDNSVYQLGDGTTLQRNAPVLIGADTDWAQIAAGRWHSIALKSNQKMYAWGYNGYGQIGNGSYTSVIAPIAIATTYNWKKIAGSANATLAIKSDDSVWIWGICNPVNIDTPQQFFLAGTGWANIKGGNNHVVAVKNDGTLYTWGNNGYGETSQPGFSTVSSPLQFGTATNWSNNISCNPYSSFVLDSSGNLYGSGYNANGELGDGTSVNKSVFTVHTCPSTLSLDDFKENKLILYPIPVKNILTIDTSNNIDILKIIVYDASGKQVKVQTKKSNTIDIESLEKGVYFVEITINNQIKTSKIIKE